MVMLLGIVGVIVIYFNVDIWVVLSIVSMCQVTYWKEFNNFENKIYRFNSAINILNEINLTWISLSDQDKKQRDKFEWIVEKAESIINYDS